MLRWKDQNKTVNDSSNAIWWDKSKDIDEKKDTKEILRQGQAIQQKGH